MLLLVKQVRRVMPGSFVREDLESLNICFQGVMQLRSGRRDQHATKYRSPTPHSLYLWRGGLSFRQCDQSPISRIWECRWGRSFSERPMALQRSASTLEEISDLLDHLPVLARVKLTRRLLTSISSLPTGTGPFGLS